MRAVDEKLIINELGPYRHSTRVSMPFAVNMKAREVDFQNLQNNVYNSYVSTMSWSAHRKELTTVHIGIFMLIGATNIY